MDKARGGGGVMTIWEWALVACFVSLLAPKQQDGLLALAIGAILAAAGFAAWTIDKLL